jgi:hypothetical protein
MARKSSNSGADTPPTDDVVLGYIEPIEINLEMERSFSSTPCRSLSRERCPTSATG